MIQPEGFPPIPSDYEYDTEIHESLDQEHAIFMNLFKRRDGRKKRALLIVHGLGEHGGRYQHFAHYLQGLYDVILAVDLRGCGRSEGIRGHVGRFDEYVDDVMLAFDVLQKKIDPSTRIDLFGHSMGGLIVLRTLLFRPDLPIQNLIVSGPAIGSKVPVPFLKEVAGRVLAKVWGSFQMETGIDATLISHDPAVVQAYIKDRLVHSKATPSFYFSMKDAMKELIEKSIQPKDDTRILLLLAAEDEIVDIEPAKLFFENLKHEDKKIGFVLRGILSDAFFT